MSPGRPNLHMHDGGVFASLIAICAAVQSNTLGFLTGGNGAQSCRNSFIASLSSRLPCASRSDRASPACQPAGAPINRSAAKTAAEASILERGTYPFFPPLSGHGLRNSQRPKGLPNGLFADSFRSLATAARVRTASTSQPSTSVHPLCTPCPRRSPAATVVPSTFPRIIRSGPTPRTASTLMPVRYFLQRCAVLVRLAKAGVLMHRHFRPI